VGQTKRNGRQTRVPASRVARLLRLGMLAGEVTVGGLAEGVKRLTGSPGDDRGSAFLTTANAHRLARHLAGLRGAAMKLGQLLSMEGKDLLPVEFAEALGVLRDSGNSMPTTQLRRVLGQAYGHGWEARFKEFDYEPVAAASIGQVHRATAVDGRELALKIQYPGVARSITSDVDNLAAMLRMSRMLPKQMDVSELIVEAKRQLRREADYLLEAELAEKYARAVGTTPGLRVPRVHRDLCTRHVLAMDYMNGESLATITAPGTPQRIRDDVGTRLQSLLFRELFEFRSMQTDPNLGNYLIDPDTSDIVLLDFGSTCDFSAPFVRRYARITRAIIDGDDDALVDAAIAIGYLRQDASTEHADRILELLYLACAPLRHKGRFDFAASDLVGNVRNRTLEMMLSSDEFHAPPAETAFLHRKLIGSFLLCARIGARVDMQKLVLGVLDRL
jgi:predicted unusual protein kinase regulating ubiquinone biosynthesis (AarF/ABC1/UbiB family)